VGDRRGGDAAPSVSHTYSKMKRVIPNAVRNLFLSHTSIRGMRVIPNAVRNLLDEIIGRIL